MRANHEILILGADLCLSGFCNVFEVGDRQSQADIVHIVSIFENIFIIFHNMWSYESRADRIVERYTKVHQVVPNKVNQVVRKRQEVP